MFKRFRSRSRPELHPMHNGFMENHPFTVYADHGWTVHQISEPRNRRPRAASIRTITLTSPTHGHVCIFDIDTQGRMRDHATYTTPTHIYYADTPTAAAQLATTPPTATPDQLAVIPNVRQIT